MADTGGAGDGNPHPVELAGLLHELTALLIDAANVQEALNRLATFARAAVPGAVRCSVTLVGDCTPMTIAAAEQAHPELDDVQYEAGRGPCLDAIRTRTLITSQDLPSDERWPELAELAAKLQVHAAVSIPLDVRRNSVGALNLFLPEPHGIDPYLLITAMAVAGQSELLLGEVLRRSAAAEMTAELVESLRAGATVDHAVGVIVAQRGCGVREAYEVLHETAQRLNLRPEVIAERLVETAARRSVRAAMDDG
jgi:transcriptional regulator with GAF, ATPase, and Fis domain